MSCCKESSSICLSTGRPICRTLITCLKQAWQSFTPTCSGSNNAVQALLLQMHRCARQDSLTSNADLTNSACSTQECCKTDWQAMSAGDVHTTSVNQFKSFVNDDCAYMRHVHQVMHVFGRPAVSCVVGLNTASWDQNLTQNSTRRRHGEGEMDTRGEDNRQRKKRTTTVQRTRERKMNL